MLLFFFLSVIFFFYCKHSLSPLSTRTAINMEPKWSCCRNWRVMTKNEGSWVFLFCFFKLHFDFIGVGYGRLVQHWTRTDNQEVRSSNPVDWPLSLFKCKKKKNIAYPNMIVFAASQFYKIYYTQNKSIPLSIRTSTTKINFITYAWFFFFRFNNLNLKTEKSNHFCIPPPHVFY